MTCTGQQYKQYKLGLSGHVPFTHKSEIELVDISTTQKSLCPVKFLYPNQEQWFCREGQNVRAYSKDWLIYFFSCRGWTDAPRPCIQCNKDAQMLIQENDAKQVLSHQLYQSLLQPMSLWLKNCFQRKGLWEGNINGDNLIFSITTPCPTENVTYTPQDCAEAQSMRHEFIPLMPSVSYLIHEHYL